ncbi:MAG: hypothetical protein NZ927_02925 [Candidatus Calescibacterium sp.]|nr:hypothetical protein [Candidatus Calescibacterium sp.]MCX7733980.1 hypothetical protein [bacterium]MDW8086421.1 hypothetical protein [Candidatus Calescibacterium sp.]
MLKFGRIFCALFFSLLLINSSSAAQVESEARERNEVRRIIDEIKESLRIINPTISDLRKSLDEKTLEAKTFKEQITKIENDIKSINQKIADIESKINQYIERNMGYEKKIEEAKREVRINSMMVRILGLGVIISIIISVVSIIYSRGIRRRSRMFRF